MPKPQPTTQALQAYSRQQRVARLAGSRPQPPHRPEPPSASWIGALVAMATQWIQREAPEVPSEAVNREALALVGDFLSLTPRRPVPHHTYRDRFRDYLDGAAPPPDDPGS